MLEKFYGNSRVVTAIENMLKTDKIPQTILLEGETGLGKHTVAHAFAKAILCGGDDACGSCRNCTLFEAGTHPDYSLVSPDEKNVIRVSVIRELRRAVYERPDRSRRKVYVIENAECMNSEAQNAFLKIMEEPPQYVVFLLLCPSRAMLLETVVSRCTVLTLNTPSPQEGAAALAEQAGGDSERLAAVLSASDNNVGMALALLNSAEQDENSENVEKILTLVSSHRSYEVLRLMQSFSRDTVGLAAFCESLFSAATLLLRRQSMGESISPSLSKQQLLRIVNAVQNAKRRIKENCSLTLLITAFCADITK